MAEHLYAPYESPAHGIDEGVKDEKLDQCRSVSITNATYQYMVRPAHREGHGRMQMNIGGDKHAQVYRHAAT